MTKRRALSWTKNGWRSTGREVIPDNAQKHTFTLPEEFKVQCLNSEVKLITEAGEEILFGRHSDKIDQLPHSVRQILDDGEEWYVSGNKLFKATDPEEQVREDGNWGFDGEDLDSFSFSKAKLATRTIIEETGLLPPIESNDDLLATVEKDNQTHDLSPFTRTSVNPDNIGKCDNSPIFFEKEKLSSVNFKTSELENQTNVDFRNPIWNLPTLREETQEALENVLQQYESAVATLSKEDDSSHVTLRIQVEEAIHDLIYSETVNRIDSPFCAFKYSSPKKGYKFIPGDYVSKLSEKKEEREKFFESAFLKILRCQSMDELFGPVVPDANNPGRMKRGGGQYGLLREYYQKDKSTISNWSITNRHDDNGVLLQESQFNTQRNQMIQFLRGDNKDEEYIRKTIYRFFDKEEYRAPAEYSMKNGRKTLKTEKISWGDSIWRKKRTEAFSELSMTKAQWDATYWALDVIRYRFNLDKSTERTEIEKGKKELINKAFMKIRDLLDIDTFIKWLNKRKKIIIDPISKSNVLTFEKAPVDYLTIPEERKLREKLNIAENHFQIQYFKTTKLSRETEGQEEISLLLPEVSISCPHINKETNERCGCSVVGIPKFVQTEKDGKGYLFLRCKAEKAKIKNTIFKYGCGKKVILYNYKDTEINPRSIDKLMELFNPQDYR